MSGVRSASSSEGKSRLSRLITLIGLSFDDISIFMEKIEFDAADSTYQPFS